MTSEQFKKLCGSVDWDAVPVPASFDDWLAEYVPDKRLRDKIGDGTVNRTRAKFEIMAEQNGVDLATVMWAVLAQCMRFGMFGANGEPFILYDIDIDIFAKKIEECAELIQAVEKSRRQPDAPELTADMVEEMADVYIMIMQFESIMGFHWSEVFDRTVADKLRRQIERIENEVR